MDEPDVLVCGDTPYITGSKVILCTKCGREVFCSPSGQGLLAENPRIVPVCVTCTEITDEDKVIPPTPEQMKEMAAFGITPEDIAAVMWHLQRPKED